MKPFTLAIVLLLALTACNATPTIALSNHATIEPTRGYITFAINVHDTVHVGESADTLLRFIALFEKYNVRGDFYLTAPMVEQYVAQRPDVIERLKQSNMTISYHVRPPHPLYAGFDQRLKTLDDATLATTIRDYETYRLDPATGNLDRSQPGGYSYVAQIFGRKPVVASPQSGDRRIRQAALKVYVEMGAQMSVLYHEEGTDPNNPFAWEHGLLVRPSDFSITRVKMDHGRENFWWNLMDSSRASEFNPTNLLKTNLAEWQGARAPFITALIHENNLYRSGPEAWTLTYFAEQRKAKPLAPLFNLHAPDLSKPRSKGNQDAIWNAYAEMVAFAAQNLRVVTSQDIVALAKTGKP